MVSTSPAEVMKGLVLGQVSETPPLGIEKGLGAQMAPPALPAQVPVTPLQITLSASGVPGTIGDIQLLFSAFQGLRR